MNTVIEFKDIKKAYGQQTIVEHFNLTIERGQFVTIIGSSGCGKTTILKMINGLIAPDEGTVYVEGKDIKNEDLIALRRNIGYSIQGSVLFPHMTVEKNIAYVPELLNKDDKARTRAAVEKWMKIVGLDPLMLKDVYKRQVFHSSIGPPRYWYGNSLGSCMPLSRERFQRIVLSFMAFSSCSFVISTFTFAKKERS